MQIHSKLRNPRICEKRQMFFSVLVPDGSKGASMLGVCGKCMRLTD